MFWQKVVLSWVQEVRAGESTVQRVEFDSARHHIKEAKLVVVATRRPARPHDVAVEPAPVVGLPGAHAVETERPEVVGRIRAKLHVGIILVGRGAELAAVDLDRVEVQLRLYE